MGSSNGSGPSGFTGTGGSQIQNLLSSSSTPMQGQATNAWNNGQGSLGQINMGGASQQLGNIGNANMSTGQNIPGQNITGSGGSMPTNTGLSGNMGTMQGFTGQNNNQLQQLLAQLFGGQQNGMRGSTGGMMNGSSPGGSMPGTGMAQGSAMNNNIGAASNMGQMMSGGSNTPTFQGQASNPISMLGQGNNNQMALMRSGGSGGGSQ